MDTTVATAKIWLSSQDALTELVEKINRRAKKLGVAPFVLTFEGEFPVYRLGPDGLPPGRLVGVKTQAIITGTPIMFAGWSLVAKFDFLGDGCIVSKAPGFETLDVDREISPGRCDHCRTSRRRAVSYLVQNESGARKVVGSTCLPDFTGMGHEAHHLLSLVNACRELLGADEGDDMLGGGVCDRGYSMLRLLETTAAMIRCYGWMSGGQAYDRREASDYSARSTAQLVTSYLGATEFVRRRDFPKFDGVSRSDTAAAKRSIHWAAQQSGNDYLDNLAVLAGSYWCHKHTGLACSMVASWQRHRGELLMRARQALVDPDAVLGQTGDKIWAVVEVLRRIEIASDFGVAVLVIMVDLATGATIRWKATGDSSDFPVGAQIQIAATIKKLDAYKGVRQTNVTRAVALRHTCVQPKPKKPTKKQREAQALAERDEESDDERHCHTC